MKKVLFVCVQNSCRSQMAEGFAKVLGGGIIEAHSAGSRPLGKVNTTAIEVMKEAGIDISKQKSKGFSELPIKEFDYVITLGCQDVCPFIPADKHIEWNIDDPENKGGDFFRDTRNKIKSEVGKLIKDIKETN